MAPKEKTNTEQKTLLMGQMDDYIEAQKHRSLAKFWSRLFPAWFHLWPMEEDTSIKDEAERRKMHGLAIKEQEGYLKTWFRYRTAPKVRASHVLEPASVAVEMPKATRCHQEVEIYSSKYYASRVLPLVEEHYKDKPVPTTEEALKTRRKITRDALDNETPAIKAEINELYLKERLAAKEEKLVRAQKIEPTPESYIAGIKSIEPRFDAFAHGLARDSGWTFILIAGGPDPKNAGCIRTASYQCGTNVFGLTLSVQDPEFKAACVPAFTKYLHSCYSPEQCAARSSQPASGTSASIAGGLSPSLVASPSPSPSNTTPCPAVIREASVVPNPAAVLADPVVLKATVVPKRTRKAAKGKAVKAAEEKAQQAPVTPNSEAAIAPLVLPEAFTPLPTIPASEATTVPIVGAAFALLDASAHGLIGTHSNDPGLGDTPWGTNYNTGFPLLSPDLDYLNDPANFLNNLPDFPDFPTVSNTPMPTTIPSGFVIPPLGTYLSLLDELDGPLPANLPGVPDQIDTHHMANNPYAVMKATSHMQPADPTAATAPPIPCAHVDKPETAGIQDDNATNIGTEAKGSATNITNAEADGTAEDAGAVCQSTRNPRKRTKRDETDTKFIVKGKRVRRQQVRTEVEPITAKAVAEKEKQKGKENLGH